jgi:tetratricopeptide (TPR) repeat protein
MKGRLLALGVATTLVIASTYYFHSSGSGGSDAVGEGGPDRSATALEQSSQVDRRELDRLIGVYETQVKTEPTVTGLTFLGQMYLTRGRLTGDVQTYLQAAAAAEQAVSLAPADRDARTLVAGIRYTTHDFAAAANDAAALVGERPTDQGALAVLGDAELELGDYARATVTYAKLGTQAPEAAAALVRESRLAFLQGRLADADRLARQAKTEAQASAFGDAGLAYYSVFEGQLDFDRGLYGDAARQYGQALREAPGYYIATAGLAKARAAQGRTADAIALYQQAIDVVPQPDFLAALGDLHHLAGNEKAAADDYGTVEVIAQLAAINKQVYNRQLAMYYADHDVKLDRALRLASTELSVRKDVYGYDAAAWALYKNGRLSEARAASARAVAQHTPDAKLWYHAGMIDMALGATAQARDELSRALSISPVFDPLQAQRARAALAQLGGPSS